MTRKENLLINACSEQDADMLYATGMFVPDPFIFLRIRGKNFMVMSDLEIDRARRQAQHCHVISLTDCQAKLRKQGTQAPRTADVITLLLREKRVRKVSVPGSFPLLLADPLRQAGFELSVPKGGAIFPEREFKQTGEVRKLTEALRMAELGLGEGIKTLRKARIGARRTLLHGGAPLTSERLRAIIDTAILQAGGVASHTIVAGGRQGCDPHEPGHGILRAGEPIILDIFPRAQQTGYFGDITRTVVKGRASEAVKKLYATVLRGQEIGFERLRAGAAGADIHKAITDYFDAQGYKTGLKNGRMQGFFHGTGHGVGLEIHEAPRIALTSTAIMQPGHVVTIEPGLYYPEIGGVRLEDMAWVKEKSASNLTTFEKLLEI